MRKFNKEAVCQEISRTLMKGDGYGRNVFDFDAIYAATKVQESNLYGLAKEPDDILDLLERAFGEDNIGYNKAGVGLMRIVN